MKKFDNFKNSLRVLKTVNHNLLEENEMYRTGVIGQFNLTFELAWKTLQEVLKRNSVMGAETGSPRETVKLGFKFGLVNDEEAWIKMLKDRNVSVHVYNEDVVKEVIRHIIEIYIPAFDNFSKLIEEKIKYIENEWVETEVLMPLFFI